MKTLLKIAPFMLALLWSCSSEDEEEPLTPEPNISIHIDQKSNVIESKGGMTSLLFSSTVPWTSSVSNTRSDGWCTISPLSGRAGEATINISATENTTPDERNATITLRADDVTETYTVVQKQKDALTVTSSKIEVPAEGGEINVEVKANVSFNYEIEGDAKQWITSASTRGLTTSNRKFNVLLNDDIVKREGTIIIRSGEMSEKVTVYQSGTEASIVITKNEYTVGSAGETIKVELKSNTDYEVQLPVGDWIAESTTRALSSHTHYFTIAKNESYDIREAEILFTNKENGVTEKVKVIQEQRNGIVITKNLYANPQSYLFSVYKLVL